MFKTISRIFDKSGLDPQANPVGSGGLVPPGALQERLRERHHGAQDQTQGRQIPLSERLVYGDGAALDRFGGDR